MPAHVRTAAVLALLIAAPTRVLAQDDDPPPRWAAEVGFGLTTSGGNEKLTVLATNISVTRLDTDQYELDAGTRFRYGRSGGEDVAQNLRGNIGLDLWPRAKWSPFLFADAENDPFKRLRLRLNAGAGVKHTFYQEEWDEVSFSGALLYSREMLTVADSLAGVPGAGISQTARWSWRGRARFDFGDGRRLEHTVFYQPAWDDFGDYLLEAVASARWALNTHLAFTTTLRYDRDSTPPPEVVADDWSLSVGLTLANRW
ncbi:MAG: DUF481 domain-containing protein [Gemmatimonadota bacterium]